MYNARCATIMDVKDPYNRVILYAFTNLLIDIVQVKAGQIADSKIRTILIQAMRSVSNVAAMREMVAAQAKQQEKSEKGVRANKRRSNESLAWVAAAAQILWNAEPYLSNREVVAVLFSAEKRANKAKPPIDPAAQAILREGPKRPLTRRTIRNKLTEARALGLVVSPQETASQSTEESAP
jgi:Na+-transporting methylmalonyl-CoA/oxaloacetate decarboxylase gamma subunit